MIIGIDPSFTACGISDGTRHQIITTSPRADEAQMDGLRRRSDEIVSGVLRFVGDLVVSAPRAFFVEAPMLRAVSNGSHLFDLGWLMNDLLSAITLEYEIECVLVPTLTLKKFASGKGNTKKDEMKLAVFKKFGVEFERDPGCDKLHAFVLHKYGEALLRGEIESTVVKRRGEGGRKRAAA